jgi:hypothetical protein
MKPNEPIKFRVTNEIKLLRNEANVDVFYTIYCNLGQFTLFIIRFAEDYKRKLPWVTINRIQNVKISFNTLHIPKQIIDRGNLAHAQRLERHHKDLMTLIIMSQV